MASNQVQAMPARLDGTNTTYWAHFMTNFERKLWKYVATKIEKPTNLIQEEWESDIGKNQLFGLPTLWTLLLAFNLPNLLSPQGCMELSCSTVCSVKPYQKINQNGKSKILNKVMTRFMHFKLK